MAQGPCIKVLSHLLYTNLVSLASFPESCSFLKDICYNEFVWATPETGGTRMKILVAHHDPTSMAMISLILISQGHEIVLAMNGDEAYSKAFSPGMVAIITSRFLEGRSGSEMASDLKNAGLEIPVILFDSKKVRGDKKFFKYQIDPTEGDLVVARLLGAIDNL